MDKVITDFFDVLEKKNKKKNKTFDQDDWLRDAASKASQIYLSSHPVKFSHPDIRPQHTLSVIAESNESKDAYLRTGNVPFESLDVSGNAAAIPCYKFLSLKLSDGKSVLEHIEEETPVAKNLLKISKTSYEELRDGFLAIKKNNNSSATDSRIKQVYFPVGKNNYHQLSILASSSLLTAMKKRIDEKREKAIRVKKQRNEGESVQASYDDIFNLTKIKYGGSQPQNISVKNSECGGEFYLLSSSPPKLKKKSLKIPKRDFFYECIWFYKYKDSFWKLHNILEREENNQQIRIERDEIILNIFDQILQKVYQLRNEKHAWSCQERFSKLPNYQKAILDDYYQKKRSSEDIEKFLQETAHWVIKAYHKVIGERYALPLYDDAISHVKDIILDRAEQLK